MRYTVALLDVAVEQLDQITSRDRKRIWNRIESLADNPHGPGTSALRYELGGYWKLRVGDYRIVYEVQDERLVVLVVAIGNRRNIYDIARQTIRHR